MLDPGPSTQRSPDSNPTPPATTASNRPRPRQSPAMRPPLYDPDATIVLIGMRESEPALALSPAERGEREVVGGLLRDAQEWCQASTRGELGYCQ